MTDIEINDIQQFVMLMLFKLIISFTIAMFIDDCFMKWEAHKQKIRYEDVEINLIRVIALWLFSYAIINHFMT